MIILTLLFLLGTLMVSSIVVTLFIIGLRWFNENITKFKTVKMILYIITFLPLFPFYALYLSIKTVGRAKEIEGKLKSNEISLTEFYDFYNKNKWVLGNSRRKEMLMTAQLLKK